MEQPSLPENKEKIDLLYTAEFVHDVAALLHMFPPKHEMIFGHHSTIAFQPTDIDGIEIGRKSSMKIVGRAYDEKGDALLVENSLSKNMHPHITLSCAEGMPPEYSNELIAKAIAAGTVEYFLEPSFIQVTCGYSDGKIDVVS